MPPPWGQGMTMKRAAIYARFSTDLQSEASIDDQVALCRTYAEREGLAVVATYEDRARSGASIFGRDGLIKLMERAHGREFDVVVVEALDRLSRDMADLAGVHRELTFLGIEICAVHDGRADTVAIGLRGLVGQLYREDGAKKVRRGMAGVVRGGRHAGGRAYGYRPIPGEKGQLAPVPAEAVIVVRILTEYAAGRPPRDIAGDLNAEGVAPPRGKLWNASTINGNAQRGTGIIFNDLYVGRLVWNKVRMVKDPRTGRRVSRPNPAAEWQTVEAAHLRLVDDDLWHRVRAVKDAKAKVMSHLKRQPAHLLSGLLKCGTCGSGMSVHDRDHTGRTRLRCSAVRESGSCSNTARVYVDKVEGAVIDGMREQLRDPRLIETFVRAYNDERRRLARNATGERAKAEARLAAIDREYERAKGGYLKGLITEEEAAAELPRLRAAREALLTQINAMAEAPKVIALHPAAMARYLETVERLAAVLSEHARASDDRGTLSTNFRALVQEVRVHPLGPRKGVEVDVRGRLASLIGGAVFPENVGRRVVAEEGLEPPTRGL
jgi:site-specific DNA recombinase